MKRIIDVGKEIGKSKNTICRWCDELNIDMIIIDRARHVSDKDIIRLKSYIPPKCGQRKGDVRNTDSIRTDNDKNRKLGLPTRLTAYSGVYGCKYADN